MERWNHQGRAPRKRHRKRPPLHRRWRLTARRLKSGRSEKQLACLCVLMLGYRKSRLMSMREVGYTDRRNVLMEARFAFGKEWRLNGLAAEIVGLNVNAIVAQSSAALFAARGHEQDKSTSL